jgi:hypothetical protein
MSEATYKGMPIPQCYIDIQDAVESGTDRIILFGRPGTGKTFSGLTAGVADPSMSERLICTEDMTSADVSGAFMPNVSGGFEFLPGAALRAWQKGSRLVIDEIDKAGGDVFAQLLAFTDTVDSASFTRPDNAEVVRPSAGYSVFMTSNIEDPRDLPTALKDRFPVAIEVNAAHPAALMALPPQLRLLAATLIAGKPGQRASLRAFYEFNRLINGKFTVERAANLIFGTELATRIIQAMAVGTLEPEFTLSV